jgi:hypothetical protein
MNEGLINQDDARPMSEKAVREDLVEAILNLNCPRNLATVQKTRRVVRDAALALEERRVRQRRSTGFALLAFFTILIFLSPAIWNSVEDIVSGEHIGDLPTEAALLLLMLMPAMLATLAAVWKEQRDTDHRRRNF